MGFHRWSQEQLKIKKNKNLLTLQYREACTDKHNCRNALNSMLANIDGFSINAPPLVYNCAQRELLAQGGTLRVKESVASILP